MDRTRDHEVTPLRDALDRLPPRPREIYRLSAVEGLDHRAVAERLGVGTDEVETLLAEAIVAIARHLGSGADG